MPWIILLASAVLEAVWATALGMSEGFSRPFASIVFAVAFVLSMFGLGRAVRHIPIGTAYAVWTGVGAALTVTYATATGAEVVSPLKVAFLAGIVLAVIGLKLLPSSPRESGPAAASDVQRPDRGAGGRRP